LPTVGEKSQLAAEAISLNFGLTAQKGQNSAVSSNWHASCNTGCIGGRAADRLQGEFEMNNFSYYLRHAMAAVAAVFVSGLLMVNGLAVSATEVSSVAGILA
jgi:hypothetical protein